MNFYSIVMPVYNEQDRIAPSLLKINNWLKKNPRKYEIIIVDDGSVDQTIYTIKTLNKKIKLNIKIYKKKHEGQFAAISFGIKKSLSKFPVVIEADLSASPYYIDILYKHVPQFDIVSGSRFLKKSKILHKPFYRDLISNFFIFLYKIMFKSKVSDPQFSFKIYNKKLFLKYSKNLVSKLDGMKSTEIMLKFETNNKKIKEIPIKYIFYESERNVRKSTAIFLIFNCFLSLFTIWLELRKKTIKP